ncbi:hypothetical protein VMUT_0936 [Vulcanisaeta moutnovskia 768-28]|uniref:Uncharacterized protein n=1 Tax=Vulcanisaeta moutnovskia (strain 768-28) TaxID=985053 RepID=F0QXA7_VULM7|nr:hypothetical protein VMUT_0936 [Vulcanisaeta moutnovskia 768-28]
MYGSNDGMENLTSTTEKKAREAVNTITSPFFIFMFRP